MSKKEMKQFVCQNCGSVYPKWQGKCDSCGEWNTIVEEIAGGGGFSNIEVVTIATSFTLANMALPVFSAMVEDGKQTYFLRKTKSVTQNTRIGAYFNVSGNSIENSYTRWKSNQGASSSNVWNTSFDCIANAGDEYYKVVIL